MRSVNEIDSMADLKNIGYRMFVLGLAMTTAFTTIALTDIGKTSVNADVERVPFYSSQSGEIELSLV